MLNKKSDKIDRVLNATLELVAEYGLHNTPMSKISKRSGVAVGTIYHHFITKEEIINALYISIKEEIAKSSFIGYDEKASYEETIKLLWRNFYKYFTENPKKLSFVEQCSTSPLITGENRILGEEKLWKVLEVIEEGIEAGYFSGSDPRLIGWHFYGSVCNIAKYTMYMGEKLDNDIIEEAITMCLSGIKK